jgi:hypothetical protein
VPRIAFGQAPSVQLNPRAMTGNSRQQCPERANES